MPINVAGLLLIALGVGLLVLELKFPTFGALGVGGVVSLVLGSIVLMGDTRDLRVGLWLIVPTMLAFGCDVPVPGAPGRSQAQRQRPVSGADGMLREDGRALTDLTPEHVGQVRSTARSGRRWRRRTSPPEHPSTSSALRGLTLLVEPDRPAGKEGSSHMMFVSPVLVVVVALVLYLLTSIKILAEYERGVIFRLGSSWRSRRAPGSSSCSRPSIAWCGSACAPWCWTCRRRTSSPVTTSR